MTQENRGSAKERAAIQNVPEHVVIELDMCSAVDRLAERLMALRLAFDAVSATPDAVECPVTVTRDMMLELQRRRVADILLMRAAVNAVETSGNELVRAVNTMLNL